MADKKADKKEETKVDVDVEVCDCLFVFLCGWVGVGMYGYVWGVCMGGVCMYVFGAGDEVVSKVWLRWFPVRTLRGCVTTCVCEKPPLFTETFS